MKTGRLHACIAKLIFSLAAVSCSWGAEASKAYVAPNSIAQNSKDTAAARSQRTVKFSGAVTRGQSFERPMAANLSFRLIPEKLGWVISVGGNTARENNYCGVVTPPYRGINTIRIEGWHFRNADNSGPNKPGRKNVNAPQKVREFYFVLDDGDYQKAFDALQILLWPSSSSKQQVDQAQNVHVKLLKGSGKLTILDLKLNSLEAGKQAGIDAMTFDVELALPR